MSDEIEIRPVGGPLDAQIALPGSKSITNRALLLAAMASGRSIIDAGLASDDTRFMTSALRGLGFNLEVDEGIGRFIVDGRGGAIPSTSADLFVGGAGTAMRFLVGFLSLARGKFRIDGNQRMRQRPIGPLLDAIQGLGGSVYSERDNRCPPVVVDNSRGILSGGEVSIDARESSQYVSALLMPAALWPRGLKLTVKGDTARPFVDMTLALMELWGVHSDVESELIVVAGGQSYQPQQQFVVEPDASAACYFAAA